MGKRGGESGASERVRVEKESESGAREREGARLKEWGKREG